MYFKLERTVEVVMTHFKVLFCIHIEGLGKIMKTLVRIAGNVTKTQNGYKSAKLSGVQT